MGFYLSVRPARRNSKRPILSVAGGREEFVSVGFFVVIVFSYHNGSKEREKKFVKKNHSLRTPNIIVRHETAIITTALYTQWWWQQ